MAQQQNQSKLGTMKPKAIIDKKAPGMDSAYYSKPSVMKKLGDKAHAKIAPMKKVYPKTPTRAGVQRSLKKTMGY